MAGKIHAIHSRNEVTFCDRSEKIEGHRFSQTAEHEFRTFLDTLSAIWFHGVVQLIVQWSVPEIVLAHKGHY